MSASLGRQAESIRRAAADLAKGMSAGARDSATAAQERAILRMIGVDGLDRAGRPLAAATVERFCGSDSGRLADGVLLPLALASTRHALEPRELALEVAAGAIDLVAEAETADPAARAAARSHAEALLGAALARFDAGRTAARVQREVLGSPHEPWLGLRLEAPDARGAIQEVRRLVARGVDVVQVTVPASWEYAEAQRAVVSGSEAESAAAAEGSRSRVGRAVRAGRLLRGHLPPVPLPRSDRDSMPAGSQRGLAELRRAADQAAAERGCYASLMTVASAFAAPEQAVVAAFERIDFVESDPIREIVEDNVDPARALADHAFAHRLQARAGCGVVMGAGPLSLGAELVSGVPSDPATRAGWALALQALGVELALACGLPPDRLLLGAVPDWVGGGAGPASYLVEAWLRHITFAAHRLVVEMPPADASAGRTHAGWTAPLVAALAGAPAALVIVEPGTRAAESGAADLAAAASAAADLRAAFGNGDLHGDAQTMAARTLRAAGEALRRLSGEGWASVLGPASAEIAGARFGHSAVVARSDKAISEGRLLEGLL